MPDRGVRTVGSTCAAGSRTLGSRHPDAKSPTAMLTPFVVSVRITLLYETDASCRVCPFGQVMSEAGGLTVSDAVTLPFLPELNVPVAMFRCLRLTHSPVLIGHPGKYQHDRIEHYEAKAVTAGFETSKELLAERGIDVDHIIIYRWVQRFTPLFADAARPLRHAVGDRWFVDET